jgi:hypothetical protein
MPRITRMAAAVLAIGLLLAVPAGARPIDDPQIQTSSLAGTTSESTQNLRGADAQGAPTVSESTQNLRGADAQGVPTAPEAPNPGPPTWPLDPEPIVRVPAQQLPTVADDGDDSPLKYILPTGAIALMVGAALAFAARPRRARANA